MWIVMVSDTSLFGPFNSEAEARTWADRNVTGSGIIEVKKPSDCLSGSKLRRL
jgi:hypothetical protein